MLRIAVAVRVSDPVGQRFHDLVVEGGQRRTAPVAPVILDLRAQDICDLILVKSRTEFWRRGALDAALDAVAKLLHSPLCRFDLDLLRIEPSKKIRLRLCGAFEQNLLRLRKINALYRSAQTF